MSSQLTKQQILIAPARALSSNRLSDYFVVAYWTIWAPLAFDRYGRYLQRMEMEAAPPSPLDLKATDLWRKANPAHRNMETIVLWVSVFMLAGIAAINAVCAAPLFPDAADAAWGRSYLFVLMFWGLLLGVHLFGWLIAVSQKNSGFLFGAMLPGVLVLAIPLLI